MTDELRHKAKREPVATGVPMLFKYPETPRKFGRDVVAWMTIAGFDITDDDDGSPFRVNVAATIGGASLVCYLTDKEGKRSTFALDGRAFARACMIAATGTDPKIDGIPTDPLDTTADEAIDLLDAIVEGYGAPARQLIEAIDNARSWLDARRAGPHKPDGWCLYQVTFRAGLEWFRSANGGFKDRDEIEIGRCYAKGFGELLEDRDVGTFAQWWAGSDHKANCPNAEPVAHVYADPANDDEIRTLARRYAAANDLEVVHVFCVDDPDDRPDLAAFLPPVTVEEPHSDDDPETEPSQ